MTFGKYCYPSGVVDDGWGRSRVRLPVEPGLGRRFSVRGDAELLAVAELQTPVMNHHGGQRFQIVFFDLLARYEMYAIYK